MEGHKAYQVAWGCYQDDMRSSQTYLGGTDEIVVRDYITYYRSANPFALRLRSSYEDSAGTSLCSGS